MLFMHVHESRAESGAPAEKPKRGRKSRKEKAQEEARDLLESQQVNLEVRRQGGLVGYVCYCVGMGNPRVGPGAGTGAAGAAGEGRYCRWPGVASTTPAPRLLHGAAVTPPQGLVYKPRLPLTSPTAHSAHCTVLLSHGHPAQHRTGIALNTCNTRARCS